ncbi:MAG TPA: OsmC family protein [Candidatus Cybelea sp.]|nr:OsmC family protein [Candidatus Cybelea sp.]
MKTHVYDTHLRWTAGDGEGTKSYRAYSRNHSIGAAGRPEIGAAGRPEIAASSDPSFRGDSSRYNPEELLVASLSSCHMLWYLHLCSANGITVVEYCDNASGSMEENGGAGQFVSVELHPVVTLAPGCQREKALDLHHEAHAMCFIARSVNFPVTVVPVFA